MRISQIPKVLPPKTPHTTKTIMTLGIVVNQFYKRDVGFKYFEGLTPMHAATATGDLLLYKKLKDKSLSKYVEIHFV